MARGKQTCKILKEIRRQIAEANDIEFVTSECRYKGDCLGTCPKCEAEVRYLEQQLLSRQLMGKAVVLAGLSAGMIAFSGCGSSSNQNADDSYRLQGEPAEIVEEDIESIGVQDDAKEGEVSSFEDSIIVKQKDIEEPLITVGEIIDPENPEKKTSYIDMPPSFPGGNTKLYEYISQNLVYPANAMDSHIQGRVIVSFIIKPDGSIADAKITKGVYTDLDNEALRVIKGLPKFNPAQLDGKVVESQFVLPIVFKLNDELTQKTEENKIFVTVEQMPEFPGGKTAMMNFISKNLKYPPICGDFQGKVYVRFLVGKTGKVRNTEIVRSNLPEIFNKEAIRVVSLLPQFKPGERERVSPPMYGR